MDKVTEKEEDATAATDANKMTTATQRIEKLREAVVRKNKAPSPALYRAYKHLMQDHQKTCYFFILLYWIAQSGYQTFLMCW